MTKSPKKAATPSWRTLMRRAKNTKLPKAERMQLREQAASLRRDERKAAKAPKRQTGMMAGGTAENFASTAVRAMQHTAMAGEAPGRGEIVGGELARKADEIAKLARKHGGVDDIQRELGHLVATAAYEAKRAADHLHMDQVKDIHHATTDKIVCSAIAAFEAQMNEKGGLPPAVTISSYTLCRMIDALNRAGYHADGKK